MSDQDMQFEEPAKVPEPDDVTETPDEVVKPRLFDIPQAQRGGAPPWVSLPPNFKFPRGKSIIFLRFRSDWTDTPWKGDPILDEVTGAPITEKKLVDGEVTESVVLWRQCVVWPINIGDKKLALGRSLGDVARAQDEFCRQMLRVVDGVAVDWGTAGDVDIFWADLGEKCRGLLHRIFNRLHVLDTEATADFLLNCVEVRTSGS